MTSFPTCAIALLMGATAFRAEAVRVLPEVPMSGGPASGGRSGP